MLRHALYLVLFLVAPAVALEAQVEFRLASGLVLKAQLRGLGAEGVLLAPEAGAVRRIDLAELAAISFPDARVRVHGAESAVLRFDLAGGDLLYGEVIDGDFDQVRLEADPGRIDLPLDRLESLRVLANAEGLAPDLAADLPEDRDILLVRSGTGIDQVVGEVARLAKTGVWFDWTGEDESLFAYRKDRVVALRLAAPLDPEPLAGIHARVHYRDGSRLSGRVTKKEGGPLVLAHPFGFELDLDASRVAAITFHGGRFSHLSDLEPVSMVETPYIEGGLRYGLRRDESLKGGPLTIGTSWFPKGLSVHSRSEIVYEIEPGLATFSASFGIDGRVADARVKGSIAFSVLLDDEVAFGPVIARAGEEARRIDALPLKGARRLVLRADFADNHHFNGWAVWGTPILARGGERR